MDETIPGWIFSPNTQTNIVVPSQDYFFKSCRFFHSILECIQDGVIVLDTDLNILYFNTIISKIYNKNKNAIQQKCYYIYQHRNTPCEDCPVLDTIHSKRPKMNIKSSCRKDNKICWHENFTIPVFNLENEVILIISYIRDITARKKVQNDLEKVKIRCETLEKQNEMLIQLLKQREESHNELEETICTNVEKFIKPSLNHIKKAAAIENINLIDGIIDEIVYPITKKRPVSVSKLTPKEMQIATLIKEGYQSKEIADRLFVSQKAVDYHRMNIRKKFKLSRSSNLRAYLETYL